MLPRSGTGGYVNLSQHVDYTDIIAYSQSPHDVDMQSRMRIEEYSQVMRLPIMIIG